MEMLLIFKLSSYLIPVASKFNEILTARRLNSLSKLTNIGSDNGLSPGRRQAII